MLLYRLWHLVTPLCQCRRFVVHNLHKVMPHTWTGFIVTLKRGAAFAMRRCTMELAAINSRWNVPKAIVLHFHTTASQKVLGVWNAVKAK